MAIFLPACSRSRYAASAFASCASLATMRNMLSGYFSVSSTEVTVGTNWMTPALA